MLLIKQLGTQNFVNLFMYTNLIEHLELDCQKHILNAIILNKTWRGQTTIHLLDAQWNPKGSNVCIIWSLEEGRPLQATNQNLVSKPTKQTQNQGLWYSKDNVGMKVNSNCVMECAWGVHSIVKLNTTCEQNKCTFSKLHHQNGSNFYQLFSTSRYTFIYYIVENGNQIWWFVFFYKTYRF